MAYKIGDRVKTKHEGGYYKKEWANQTGQVIKININSTFNAEKVYYEVKFDSVPCGDYSAWFSEGVLIKDPRYERKRLIENLLS